MAETASTISFRENYVSHKSSVPTCKEILLQCEIAKLQEQLQYFSQENERKKDELSEYRLSQCENKDTIYKKNESLINEITATRYQMKHYMADINILKKDLQQNAEISNEKIDTLMTVIVLLQNTCSEWLPSNTFVWQCPRCKFKIPINIITYHLSSCYC